MSTRSEEIEQARLVKWTHRREVREVMPALRWMHHSPNGGKRDGLTGAQMKALGVKPGFPDLILPYRFAAAPGLVIEMKSATGRTTDTQDEWLGHFGAEGWVTAVCRSAQEAREVICEYLGVDPAKAPALDA